MLVERITAKQNKRILRLHKLLSKTGFRREEGLSAAPGIKLFRELTAEKTELSEIYVTDRCLPAVKEELRGYEDKVFIITDEIAAKLSDQKTPEGIFCIFQRPVTGKEIKRGRYLILDGLQDIGNVGTIIRTADAFSLDGVILSPDSCDIFSPKGLRTSMGSVLRVNISEIPVRDALEKMNRLGIETYAAVLSADPSDNLADISFPKDCAVVIGNEGNGISKEVQSLCARRLTIPMSGSAESLNASVAAGIIMYSMVQKNV